MYYRGGCIFSPLFVPFLSLSRFEGMSFLKKVFAAGQGGGGAASSGSPNGGQQQQFGGANGGGGGFYGGNNGGNGNGGPSPTVATPTAGGGGGGGGFGMAMANMNIGGLKSFGANLTGSLVPQGIATAVQTRKVAGQVSTLLLRIQTSTLGRDRREAIGELCDLSAAEVAEHVRAEDVSMLLMVADMNQSDRQLLTKIFELIAAITEERVVADAVRDGLLRALLDSHVGSFLDALVLPSSPAVASPAGGGPSPTVEGGDGGFEGAIDSIDAIRQQTFWVRYHSVKILQRLHEFDGPALQRQLLASNSIGAIIDLLQDGTNDGALRSEGMALLEHVTMADSELQTILAFDSGFERLLGIVHAEGGVCGDVTAVDCLRIIHNMLRSNKATQKFFREMGLASGLRPLLVDAAFAPSGHSDAAHAHGVGSPDGRVGPRGLEVILSTLDIIQALLRFGDSNGEGAPTRDSLAGAGLVEPLCRIAFSTRLDERTAIAALRVIALLAVSHKPTGEQMLSARLTIGDAAKVPALWACLRAALYNSDTAQQAAALQIIGAAMQTAGTGAQIASFLVKGLAPFAGAAAAAAIASQQSSRDGGLQCGLLLSACLMAASAPTPNSRYYAAWVLNQSLLVPQITEQMLFLPWGAQRHTFFLAYIRQLEEVIKARQCNLATVAMLIRPLFTWFAFCGKGIYMFLGWTGGSGNGGLSSPTNPNGGATAPTPRGGLDSARGGPNQNNNNGGNGQQQQQGGEYFGLAPFNFFLEWSNNTRDPTHIRFLCAMVCVAAVVACPSADLPPSILTSKEDLMRRFCASVRLGMLEELVYNVSSSPEWAEPPADILHTRTTDLILYDRDYVAILGELSATARRWLSAAPPPAVSQQQGHGQQQPMMMAAMAGPPHMQQQQQQGGGGQMLSGQQQQQQQFPPQMGGGAGGNGAVPSSNAGANAASAAAAAAAQRQLQQQHQQLQQYESIIRQLQAELQTRDGTIATLSAANDQLTLQNDELSTARDRSTSPPAAAHVSANNGAAATTNASLLAAKDSEIASLKEALRRSEEALNASTAAAAAANDTTVGNNNTAAAAAAEERLQVLEAERDELLILVAELDEENEVLKQMHSAASANVTMIAAEGDGGALVSRGASPDRSAAAAAAVERLRGVGIGSSAETATAASPAVVPAVAAELPIAGAVNSDAAATGDIAAATPRSILKAPSPPQQQQQQQQQEERASVNAVAVPSDATQPTPRASAHSSVSFAVPQPPAPVPTLVADPFGTATYEHSHAATHAFPGPAPAATPPQPEAPTAAPSPAPAEASSDVTNDDPFGVGDSAAVASSSTTAANPFFDPSASAVPSSFAPPQQQQHQQQHPFGAVPMVAPSVTAVPPPLPPPVSTPRPHFQQQARQQPNPPAMYGAMPPPPLPPQHFQQQQHQHQHQHHQHQHHQQLPAVMAFNPFGGAPHAAAPHAFAPHPFGAPHVGAPPHPHAVGGSSGVTPPHSARGAVGNGGDAQSTRSVVFLEESPDLR